MSDPFNDYVDNLRTRVDNDPELQRAVERLDKIRKALGSYMTLVMQLVVTRHTINSTQPVHNQSTFELAKVFILEALELPEIARFINDAPIVTRDGAVLSITPEGLRRSFSEVNAPKRIEEQIVPKEPVAPLKPKVAEKVEKELPKERKVSDPFARLRARGKEVTILGGECDQRKLDRMRNMSGLGRNLIWLDATNANNQSLVHRMKSGNCIGVIILESLISHKDFNNVVAAARTVGTPLTYGNRVNIERILGCLMLIEAGRSSSIGHLVVPFNPDDAFYMPTEVAAEVVEEVPEPEVEEDEEEPIPNPEPSDVIEVPVLWAKSYAELYRKWYKDLSENVMPLMHSGGSNQFPNGFDLDSIMGLLTTEEVTVTHRRMVGSMMTTLGYKGKQIKGRTHYTKAP